MSSIFLHHSAVKHSIVKRQASRFGLTSFFHKSPHLLEIYDASALSLHKKQSSTYQKRHGCRWFQAAASFSSEKLVVGQRTRTYAVQHACGCFLYAPSIYSAYLQKGRLHLANSTTFLQTINYLIKHGKRYSVLYTKMSFSDWDSPIQTKLNPSLRKTGFLGA